MNSLKLYYEWKPSNEENAEIGYVYDQRVNENDADRENNDEDSNVDTFNETLADVPLMQSFMPSQMYLMQPD